MAMQLPSTVPTQPYVTALHPLKRDYHIDERAAESLVEFCAVGPAVSTERVQVVFEITGNRLMELIGTITNQPIANTRFSIQFTLNGAAIVIDDNNSGWRLLRGIKKKNARKKMQAMLRPVISEALRPYGLSNKSAFVSKLVKTIVLKYLNLISDRRIDMVNGQNFTLQRIERP